MRKQSLLLLAPLFYLACSSTTGTPAPVTVDVDSGIPSPRNDAAIDQPDGSNTTDTDGGTVNPGPPDAGPTIGPAQRIIPTASAITGLTTDADIIFRDDTGLMVQPASVGGAPLASAVRLATGSANVMVRGHVVFVWTNVNYTTNIADLSIWSRASGVVSLGKAYFSEAFALASDDGARVIFANNLTADTMDVNLVLPATGGAAVIAAAAGRGSLTTCGAAAAVSGELVVVGACAKGSFGATITAFRPAQFSLGSDAGADGGIPLVATTIAAGAQPNVVVDGSGKVFFVTLGGDGIVWDGKTKTTIDKGVTFGAFANGGRSLLYAVGDQLRRTPLDVLNPAPIVTVGFSQRAGFSSDLSYALYSTTVDYTGGQHQDLRLAKTDSLNSTPDILVKSPTATLSRSVFTADSKFVFWLDSPGSGVSPGSPGSRGSTLHARATSGGQEFTFPNVQTVAAASASRIVFSASPSPANVYPPTAALLTADLGAGATAATQIEPEIVDGQTFQITSDGKAVVYTLGAKADAGIDAGVYLRTLP